MYIAIVLILLFSCCINVCSFWPCIIQSGESGDHSIQQQNWTPPPHWMIYEVVRPERSGELAQSIEFLKINQKFEAILGRRKMAWKNDKSKN